MPGARNVPRESAADVTRTNDPDVHVYSGGEQRFPSTLITTFLRANLPPGRRPFFSAGVVGSLRFGVEYVMLSYWPVLVGILVLLFTLREIFQDLFHPSESGSLSEFIARGLFSFLRPYPKLLSDAGP